MGLDSYGCPGGDSGHAIARKLTDQTVNNSDVLVNDTGLFLPLGAGQVWAFRLCGLPDFAAVNIKAAFTVPAGAALWWYDVAQSTSVETVSGAAQSNFGDVGTTPFDIFGFVAVGATPGNLQFQWAQTTPDVSDNKVLADSYLIGWMQ